MKNKNLSEFELGNTSNSYSSDASRLANRIILISLFFLAVSVYASSREIGWGVWQMLTGGADAYSDFFADRMEDTSDYFQEYQEYGVLAPGGVWIGFFFSLFTMPLALWMFQLLALGTTFLSISFLITNRPLYKPVIFVLFSFPFLFAYFRGNNDIWQFPMLALYLGLLQRKKFIAASICLGLISSVEPYNAVFAVLLFAFGIRFFTLYFCTLVLIVASLHFIGSRDLIRYFDLFQYTSAWYSETYIIGNNGLLANNSLWGFGKFFLFEVIDTRDQSTVASIYPFFAFLSLIGIIVAIAIAYFVKGNIKKTFESFALLGVSIVLFAPTSATYKLVILTLILTALIFKYWTRELNIVAILLTVTIIPKNWIWFRWPEWMLGCTLDTVLNPLILSSVYLLLVSRLIRGLRGKSSIQ